MVTIERKECHLGVLRRHREHDDTAIYSRLAIIVAEEVLVEDPRQGICEHRRGNQGSRRARGVATTFQCLRVEHPQAKRVGIFGSPGARHWEGILDLRGNDPRMKRRERRKENPVRRGGTPSISQPFQERNPPGTNVKSSVRC